MTTAPVGPASLYWQAWLEGAQAMRAGDPILACPYGTDREFTGRAWRDGWRETGRRYGVTLPSDEPPVDHSAPAPRG